ncbi:hypothetical protein JHD52_16275, partial [Lactobacillus sp. CRM56-2]|nr:hypothetical protein [Lactobacillus sp. CRM56-2]
TMRAAVYIVDFGPGAGEYGGEVMAAGTPKQVARSRMSLCGHYLSGIRFIPLPETRRPGIGKKIRITGAAENNLKQIVVDFPLGEFV